MQNTRHGFLAQTFATVGLSTILLVAGCAVPAEQPPAPSVSETVSSSPSASTTETATATATATATPSASAPSETAIAITGSEEDPYGWGLVAASEITAGSTLTVTGGKYRPGVKVTIYGAKQMPKPSYDAVNDMYIAGEEVFLTEKITAVTNAKGQFNANLPVPAGVAPQLMNVVSVGDDNSGFLVQTTVK